MSYRNFFIDGEEKEIDWVELNQLKKDILWVFVQNTGELNASFVPSYSFANSYWKYLTLNGTGLNSDDLRFYINGVLVIVLCMTIEYIDLDGGDQKIFGESSLNEVIKCVDEFYSNDRDQLKLKEIILLGLSIAKEIEKDAKAFYYKTSHPDLKKFYGQLTWVDNTFIRSYFGKLVE